MVVIDVDRFKAVNDSYGHLVGDKALESISGGAGLPAGERHSGALRRRRIPAADAAAAAGRAAAGDGPHPGSGAAGQVESHPEIRLSISVGGVCGVHPLREAIRQADDRMYQNKARNKE